MWRLRLQLRKSRLLKDLVRALRQIRPDSFERQARAEVAFWRRWLVSEGLSWPEDYRSRFDPAAPIRGDLALVIDRVLRPKVEILDVGAGPVTAIGKIHPTKEIAIVATDPLADEYDALLRRYRRVPLVRTLRGFAETLHEVVGSRQFDIVHAQNSLDHSADPVAGVEEMLAVTKPGGFVFLFHEENEGKKEMYYAFHKWDFTCEKGNFVIRGPGPAGKRRNITGMLAGRAEVECSVEDGLILVVARKLR